MAPCCVPKKKNKYKNFTRLLYRESKEHIYVNPFLIYPYIKGRRAKIPIKIKHKLLMTLQAWQCERSPHASHEYT